MTTKKTTDKEQKTQPSICSCFHALRNKRDQLTALSAGVEMIRAGFSTEDDWTKDDELRARVLCELEGVLDTFAADLVALKQEHAKALEIARG